LVLPRLYYYLNIGKLFAVYLNDLNGRLLKTVHIMISDVLVLLKNRLNVHLTAGWDPSESREDPVVFIDGENMEPLTFKLGAVSVLLINIEEENTLRAPDLYRRSLADGSQQKVFPEIRLNLYVLFVSRLKEYEATLRSLSQIVQYFQNQRLLNQHNAPDLPEDIDQLIIELVTLPFAEQNEVWNALRTTYHPSVLYRIKMIVFRDKDATSSPGITETILRTSL
jgi:hypothetical protein